MKYDTLTKTNVRDLRRKLEIAFAQIQAETGVAISAKTIRFDSNTFRATIEGTLAQDGVDAAKVEFEKNCHRVGLSPEHFGAQVTIQGMKFRITGVNTRRPKFPISVENVANGKAYKVTRTQVLNQL